MKRELWLMAKAFKNGVMLLNAAFCIGDKEDKEVTDEEKWLIVEQINADCSTMVLEDVKDIMDMLFSIPAGRLCERTDCNYHHPLPKNLTKYNYTTFKDKCDDCHHNEKCADPDSAINHFEDFPEE